MKLIRFGNAGEEKPGLILEDGRRVDASSFAPDWNEEFFGGDGMDRLKDWIVSNAGSAPDVPADARLGSAVPRPSKILCIGLNFSDHAAETGAELPKEPIIFMKASSTICGPNDNLIIPRDSEKTDWEVELAFVVGKRASYVNEADALKHIAGYALLNDYSERAFQIERGGQWVKGKSADTFAPVGPYLATPDEIENVDDLKMWLKVNGETRQDGTSANLVFKIPHLLSYISQFMTLLPGDIVSTGTPAGVAMGMDPPPYLRPGDVVELGIEGLGSSSQTAVAHSD